MLVAIRPTTAVSGGGRRRGYSVAAAVILTVVSGVVARPLLFSSPAEEEGSSVSVGSTADRVDHQRKSVVDRDVALISAAIQAESTASDAKNGPPPANFTCNGAGGVCVLSMNGGKSKMDCVKQCIPTPILSTSSCDAELKRDCNTERRTSFINCAVCAGAHTEDLRKAGCSQPNIENFCNNETCALQLQDTCAASTGNCAICKTCVRKVSLCKGQQQQQDQFCAAGCASTLVCHMKMRSLCDSERRSGGVMACAQCSGVHQMELKRANCTETMLSSFCSGNSCIPKLSNACEAPPSTADVVTATGRYVCVCWCVSVIGLEFATHITCTRQ